VLHAAWDGEGRRIVTASQDGSARVWDARTGDQLFPLSGHTESVVHAAWDGEGRRIVTASYDGSARIHLVDVDELLVFSCARTDRNLTHEEWERYIGVNVPYERTCPDLPLPPDW
jgi:WD40 repeat protein